MSPAEQPDRGVVRIVMITQPSKRADAILAAFHGAGLEVAAVILDQGALRGGDKVTRTRQVWRRSGPAETARRIGRRLRRGISASRGSSAERYTAAGEVFPVRDINSEDAQRLLAELNPDLVVLGSSRILKRPIIEIPKMGVLNAHPGLLPDYRGVDVIPWALHQGDPLGVTVHFVDVGIDTGALVSQREFDPAPGDTLASLDRKADAVAGDLMADVVSRLCSGEQVEEVPQNREAGRLYTRMSPAQRRCVAEELASRWEARDRPDD